MYHEKKNLEMDITQLFTIRAWAIRLFDHWLLFFPFWPVAPQLNTYVHKPIGPANVALRLSRFSNLDLVITSLLFISSIFLRWCGVSSGQSCAKPSELRMCHSRSKELKDDQWYSEFVTRC